MIRTMQKALRSISVWGAALLFVLAIMLEFSFGSLFYSFSYWFFKDNPIGSSICINIGLVVTKISILMVLARMVLVKDPVTKADFEEKISSRNIGILLLLSVLLVVGFRLVFETSVGKLAMSLLGTDPGLEDSMNQILGAPLQGLIYILLVAPIYEELLFRGIFFGGFIKSGMGAGFAAVISSLLFGAMHLSALQGVNAFFLGLLCAYVYQVTGNMAATVSLHVMNNVYVVFASGKIDRFLDQTSARADGLLLISGILVLGMSLKMYKKKAAQKIELQQVNRLE